MREPAICRVVIPRIEFDLPPFPRDVGRDLGGTRQSVERRACFFDSTFFPQESRDSDPRDLVRLGELGHFHVLPVSLLVSPLLFQEFATPVRAGSWRGWSDKARRNSPSALSRSPSHRQ